MAKGKGTTTVGMKLDDATIARLDMMAPFMDPAPGMLRSPNRSACMRACIVFGLTHYEGMLREKCDAYDEKVRAIQAEVVAEAEAADAAKVAAESTAEGVA